MKHLCERLARWARGYENHADLWFERFTAARPGDTIFLEIADRSRVKPGYIEGLTKFAETHGIRVLLLLDGVCVSPGISSKHIDDCSNCGDSSKNRDPRA